MSATLVSAPPVAPNPVLDALVGIKADIQKQGEQIATLETRVSEKSGSSPTPAQVFGTPGVRKGENTMSSRGYSFLKLIGYCARQLEASQCTVELDFHNKIHKELIEGTPYQKAAPNSIMVPFSSNHLSFDVNKISALASEMRELVNAGMGSYDPDELMSLRKEVAARRGKALSWVDQSTGGALVAPPIMGELIDLFRNNEAFLNAGARDIGMPPSGRITWPRQTGASTAYWVGESTTITDSTPATGDLILTAKKLGVLVKIPNELFRFATISAEAFVREDMAKVMALELDKALLESVGSNLKPKGLINYAGIQTHVAATTGTDGDTFQPEDIADMIGKVEERNATFRSWIMRPRMYSKLRNRRADAVTAADGKGMFLFDLLRSVTDDMHRDRGMGELEGHSVVKSTNVSNTRTKGAGTALTYILGGDFTDYVMALSGVIEFLVANQGDTMIQQDQTWVRGIQLVDGAPRHEASFIYCDTLNVA